MLRGVKKFLIPLFSVFLLIAIFASAKPNGVPFQELWDAIDNLQAQIDSFFDIFVTIEAHDANISNLQSQIDALDAKVGALEASVECIHGQTRSCGSDVGACQSGTQTCTSGAWGACAGEVTPTAEVCDRIDNDCNGLVDEGNVCGACPQGLTQCGQQCVNFFTDPNNCGACGIVCGGGSPLCNQGICVAACDGGQTQCGSSCVEPETDPFNCGECGTVCATNEVCSGGGCTAA